MSCHCNDRCCGEHSHEHNHEEHCEQTSLLIIRLIAGAILFGIGLFTDYAPIFGAAYAILGYDVIFSAFKNIKNIFNENFLMFIATAGAFILGEYPEAAAVMMFYQLGEFLSDCAVDKSKKSISSLMDLRADTTTVLRDGKFVQVPCEEVAVGDIILITTGERVPIDGKIISGSAYFDTSAITGESVPVLISENGNVTSGIINTNSAVQIRTDKTFSDSTVSKILELVQSGNRAKSEKFISKFAKIYTPIVVAAAVLTAIVPSIVTHNPQHWVYTALLLLVVSCPCALVVSVPLTFFAGIGSASQNGILAKGGYALENLAKVKNIAFDKTGTLTEGIFGVHSFDTIGDGDEVKKYTAYAEAYSQHPIAKAVVEYYGEKPDASAVTEYNEFAGKGVSALVDGRRILVGQKQFLIENGIECEAFEEATVFTAIDGKLRGGISVGDKIKSNAAFSLKELRKLGIDVSILSGDTKKNAENVSKRLGIDKVYSGLFPQDKAEVINELKKDELSAFVGDGINDAPVLSCSDVGISMGGLGSDAAIEASDMVIMADDLEKLPLAVRISRKTMKIVKQNIFFALGIKFLIMLLGFFGITTMWLAVFADAGVCLLAVLNSLRALRIQKNI